MNETVRARYMGNPAEMWLDSGHPDDLGQHIELLHRHIYELPLSTVEGREDFIIQEEQVSDEDDARAKKEKAAEAHDTKPVSKARPDDVERAVDSSPREEG